MPSFIRYRDKITKREVKIRVSAEFKSDADAREWFDLYIRNAEFMEFAPWVEEEHGGVMYTVPLQNVQFATDKPGVIGPDPVRKSILFSQRMSQRSLLGKSLLRGTKHG